MATVTSNPVFEFFGALAYMLAKLLGLAVVVNILFVFLLFVFFGFQRYAFPNGEAIDVWSSVWRTTFLIYGEFGWKFLRSLFEFLWRWKYLALFSLFIAFLFTARSFRRS